MKAWTLLLCGLLVAGCASTNPTLQRWQAAEAETGECDAPGADRCTLFLCGVEACALYFCEDVDPSRIVRAQALAPVRPPARPPPRQAARPLPVPVNPQRYRGSMHGLPEGAEPIFIIPWNETSEEYEARLRKELEDSPKRTWVKHHVFPRAFKAWFNSRGINIHEWTLVLDKQVHQNIHRGEAGGPWNAEWNHYILNNIDAPRQAIHLFAVQLIFRFELSGPVVPYYSKKPIPLFPVVEEDIY
ncbi:SitA6 family polymorphic toxin lipoprotein [Pyxidicoccus xibeiensis]|uniref:SitA6 family polymorphic toxin lipoprotein n=1 Tax=Pyxidicoccus xibeiensis TaxID=2906759 RepID=UPI0020A79B8E|nr:TIGR02269 family lipoprotein [Pyxidicoccus xibeiensis]MCP3136483.1 TIGR02269 family lipoprotein [Pyxidicoccus xibeiensis]